MAHGAKNRCTVPFAAVFFSSFPSCSGSWVPPGLECACYYLLPLSSLKACLCVEEMHKFSQLVVNGPLLLPIWSSSHVYERETDGEKSSLLWPSTLWLVQTGSCQEHTSASEYCSFHALCSCPAVFSVNLLERLVACTATWHVCKPLS